MFDSLVLERILCVVMDIALDMCSSMIIPVVLFQPYYVAFDREALTFGIERLYDDVWYVTMVRVMQQVCVVSWLDLILTWIPHYSIYASIHLLVGLVRPSLNRTTVPRARIKQNQEGPSVSDRHADIMKETSHSHPSAQAHRRRREFARSETHKVKWLWAAQSLTVAWGFILLTSFIFSGYIQDTAKIHNGNEWGSLCKVQVRSWFTRKLAWSVLYLDCFQFAQHQPTSLTDSSKINDAIEVVFNGIEQPIIAVVVFAHCPALQISPLLQNFRNLVGMEIFNSTIVEWPKTASLAPERHPQIGYLIISRSNFTSFPEGLRGPLPNSLCDIEISTTNLTQLPPDLHERWTGVTTLYVEYSNLTSLPFSLAHLPVNDLSLVGNKISSLDWPEWKYELPYCSRVSRLSLGYNPLQDLPIYGFCGTNGIDELAIEGTAIRELPPWTKSVRNHIYAFKSPVCDSPSKEEVEGGLVGQVFSCEDSNKQALGRFPLDTVTARRRINSV